MNFNLNDIHVFFHKGKDDIKQSEVGFLVHKDMKKRSKNSMEYQIMSSVSP